MCSKKIVITGASGFLGSNLVKKLKDDERYHVFALTSRTDELKERIGGSTVEYLTKDSLFQNGSLVSEAVVVNCAFPRNSTGTGMAEGLKYIQKVFEASVDNGATAIINISSQSVYSQQRTEAATEKTEICLESPYAVGKYATELMLEGICLGKDIKYTNLRLASLIGPDFDQRIVNRFVKQAMQEGKLIVVLSDQKYGFLDILDAVDGLMQIIQHADKPWEHIYTLGNELGFTIREIAEAVASEMKKQNKIVTIDEKKELTTYKDLTVRSDKFMHSFNWSPKVSLEESIRTIAKKEVSIVAGD